MDKIEFVGLVLAAFALGHLGARGAENAVDASRRFLTDCFAHWMDGLDDLSPGRLAHGQGEPVTGEAEG